MKTHSAPYVPLTKTREQIAEHIAAGFPSPVQYAFERYVEHPVSGRLHLVAARIPVHLRRA